MKKVLLLVLLMPILASAETPCDEWANMTKILVVRWQTDTNFKNRELPEVQKELESVMHGHPELPTAHRLTTYAYKHKDSDPVKVWNSVYKACMSERAI